MLVEHQEVEMSDSKHAQKHNDDGVTLCWSRIVRTVEIVAPSGGLLKSTVEQADDGSNRKTILKGISAQANPGEIMALMGPSGSGKTTLLDCLSGRTPFDSGRITVNGQKLSKAMKRKIAYVKQQDLFFMHLTVRDQLSFTAKLRLPSDMTASEKELEVQRVISLLKLNKCADTPIMMISGGEKKRTNIGTELLTDPWLMMLDEPTSGLDSTSAVALLTNLHELARSGKTILTSIHQPSSAVFAAFDRLLLLADGSMVYSGTPQGSLAYFEKQGLPCPTGYNAADHCMDVLVVDSGVADPDAKVEGGDEESGEGKEGDKQSGTTRARLIAAWDSEASALEVEKAQEEQAKVGRNLGLDEDASKWAASYCTQIEVLTHRCMLNSRSALFTKLNFLKSIGLGVIVGLCWFQLGDSEKYAQDRSGYIFFAMTFWCMDSAFTAVMAFPSEREVLFKERASGSYRLSAYFLAKTLSEAPMRLVLPFSYILFSYWMANMNPSFVSFIGHAGTELLCVLTGESIGLAIGALFLDFECALVAVALCTLGLMLTGGFFVENIPSFIAWAKFLSPFKYSYDGCLALEFRGVQTNCDGSGELKACGGLSTGHASSEKVLDQFNVQGSISFNIGLLFLMFIVLRVIAYLSLRYRSQGGGRP